jgi:peptidoglycan DL-endopeptidase CwlO
VPYLLLASVAGLLSASQVGVAFPARSSSPAIAAKQAEAAQVLAEINQLSASLDRSDELVNLANLKLRAVRHEISINKRELVVATRNLKTSRRMIASRLVNLYASGGQSSTLEVILGAQNLGDMLNRIDAANRVSGLDAQVTNQVVRFRADVLQNRQALSTERAQARRLVAQRAAEKNAIEVRIGEQRALLSSVNTQVQQMIAAQEAAQQAAALRASRRAEAQAAVSQTQATQSYAAAAVGASAAAPSTTTSSTTSDASASVAAVVVPPSGYSGVVGVAMSYIGTPYVWAGASPAGFDCSGLVMYSYAQEGVSLPHSSYAMWSVGTSVPKDQLEPGDIVFFDGLGHVGIYIGGGEFVHAPHTGTDVQVSSLDSGSYAASYDGARRILG